MPTSPKIKISKSIQGKKLFSVVKKKKNKFYTVNSWE